LTGRDGAVPADLAVIGAVEEQVIEASTRPPGGENAMASPAA
jgi:hypothetical protein